MKTIHPRPQQNVPKASRYAYEALAEDFFFIQNRKEYAAILRRRLNEIPENAWRSRKMGARRWALPDRITRTQPPGKEWVIERRGKSTYAFRLLPIARILPNPRLAFIKIPDATPEVVAAYALSDEQALLAKVRYNRLLDIFLGVAAYSLQNHLRTTVAGLGQVEIDEIYVAIDKRGRQYVLPVQAKGGTDRLSTVQTRQDMACCAEKFPNLLCRAISAQFIEDDLIALFELVRSGDDIRIAEERHYKLVPADQISGDDLRGYDA